MRVAGKDPKGTWVKLVAETLDDLWHLHNLVDPGDMVTMSTLRTPEESADKLRAEKLAKQRITLTLRVERVEFHEFSDRLRILGEITDGPRDHGMHHTFNLEADGTVPLRLAKPNGIRRHHWDRIEEAKKAAKRPLVTIVALDDEEAVVAVLRQYGVQTAATIRGRTGGKQYKSADGRPAYFAEVLDAVARTRAPDTPLIVVGPGFTREEFLDFARQKNPGAVIGCMTEGTGQAGAVGVQEALKRGIVERIQRDQQVSVDTRLIESIFGLIARNGPVAYGGREVASALDAGAVEQLIVSDTQLRAAGGEALMYQAHRVGAGVHVVASTHEAGRRLESIGGIAATLRFRLDS